MDFKLPSSTKRRDFWKKHRKFLKVAKGKEIFTKIVITSSTTTDDMLDLIEITKKIRKDIPVVLQPVTTSIDSEKPGRTRLKYFRKLLRKSIRRVEIIPQMHKMIGVK